MIIFPFSEAYFVLWEEDQRDRKIRGSDYQPWFEHLDQLPHQHTFGVNAEWVGEYVSRPRRVAREVVDQTAGIIGLGCPDC